MNVIARPVTWRWWLSQPGAAPIWIGVVLLLGLFVATAYQPLMDLHGFRQTQTAISVWAMANGGPWLAYQTPILGTPWQVPFEFPVFQWFALLLWKLSGQTIEFSGRLASVTAMLLAIWPIRRLARRIAPDPAFASGLVAVVLTAPVVAFWARTYMIETTALLFAVAWLGLLLDAADRPQWWAVTAALVVGSLAAATKITTFAPFFGFGLALLSWHAFRRDEVRFPATRWMLLALLLAIPVAAGLAWTAYTDAIKEAAPLTRNLTSEALQGWNLGTRADRMSPEFVRTMLLTRPLAVFGPALVALPLLLTAGLWRSRRLFLLGALCLCVYLGAFVLFPKLYRVHDYYQVAVAPFLCATFVLALWSITGTTRRRWFLAGILLLQASQVGYLFASRYGDLLATDGWSNSLVRAGRFARSHSAPGDGILVVGTGYNSAIPFYAERRSIALPPWASPKQMHEMFDRPDAYFGDAKLSLAYKCTYTIAAFTANRRQLIESYFEALEPIPGGRFGSCQAYYVR